MIYDLFNFATKCTGAALVMAMEKFSVLLEFEASKMLVTSTSAPDNLHSILEEKLRRVDKDLHLVIDYRCPGHKTFIEPFPHNSQLAECGYLVHCN